MGITVIDVAREAGVSRTTVSNVFAGKARCTEETRQAVLAAAQKLGYKPNLAARALITHKSGLVGLLLPFYINVQTLTNHPFYNIIIDSIYSVLRHEAYYDLIIFSLPARGSQAEASEWIDTRGVDGILAIGEFTPAFLAELDTKSIPTVLIDSYAERNFAHFSFVNSDDENGGYLAGRQLIARGCRQIALCGLDLSSPLMQRRCQGFQRAVSEAGLAEHIFDRTGVPFDTGLQYAEMLVSSPYDGIFCPEDMLAAGVAHGLLAHGRKVGQDYALVGFDNLPIGRQIWPELTTIDQQIFSKGVTAIQLLLDILRKNVSRPTALTLPVSLVLRQTA